MATVPKNNKVLLGLSGGVDSTAAALLLREKGYEVTGLFFDVLGNQRVEREAAEKAAHQLQIPFLYKDVAEAFNETVISNFCESYLHGETPNPCILCNPTIKFRVMQEVAAEIGAYHLATGHYARVRLREGDNHFYIFRGASARKDQSYMLYRLDQSVLSRLLLPLGEIEDKSETRQMVRDEGIYNADKKDSQEICFIKKGSYIDYMKGRGCLSAPGDFVDQSGTVLGRHQGLLHYTIGQRKGLGMTFGKPTFVVALDFLKNQVILGDDQDLFNRIVFAEDTRLSCYDDGKGSLPKEYEGKKVWAKIRYASPPAEGTIHASGNTGIKICFSEPQRAATPGQSVVFYDGDRLLGGGFIADSLNEKGKCNSIKKG